MTSPSTKRFLLPAALVAGGVTVGSFVSPIGLASAEDTDSDTSTDASTDADASTGSDSGKPDRGSDHRHGRRGHGPRTEAIEETLGLTADEIRDALADGKSLADLAAEQGMSAEELTAALVEAAEARIDEAVAAGKIDADDAEARKAELSDKIAEMITRVPSEDFGERRGPRQRGLGAPFRGGVDVLEETLGLSSEEIRAGLDEGKTLAELAEEQGVPVDDVADALVARATERIDEAVADGKIDEDRAAEAKEDLDELIDQALEAEAFDLGRGVGRGESQGLRFHHRNNHHDHDHDQDQDQDQDQDHGFGDAEAENTSVEADA